MPLVWVDGGITRALTLVLRHWPTPRRIGLYSAPETIDRHRIAADLTPVIFSGYDGERTLPSVWDITDPGPNALGTALPIEWVCDGGGSSDYVQGFYILDDDGTLLCLQSVDGKPVGISAAGQSFRVDLKMAAFTKYGGET